MFDKFFEAVGFPLPDAEPQPLGAFIEEAALFPLAAFGLIDSPKTGEAKRSNS